MTNRDVDNLHKDTISNGRCVVPLRKEVYPKVLIVQLTMTTQMSSQQVVNNLKNNENNYVTLLLCRKTMDKKEGAK